VKAFTVSVIPPAVRRRGDSVVYIVLIAARLYGENRQMYPIIPIETMSGGVEVLCCFFTAVTAFLGYFVTMRF